MQCCWISEEESPPCGEEANLCWDHLSLCEAHRTEYFSIKQSHLASSIAKLYESGQLTQHSAGYTYIVLLGNGNIKIGYSGTKHNLAERWKKLSREFGGRVEILAVLLGGMTQEACLHNKFRHHRITGLPLEQFTAAKEIISYSGLVGIDRAVDPALLSFARWRRDQVFLSAALYKKRGLCSFFPAIERA